MKIIHYQDAEFSQAVDRLVNRSDLDLSNKDEVVRQILVEVKDRGDEAVIQFTRKFDGGDLSLSDMRVTEEEIKQAYEQVTPEQESALRQAAENIRKFHQKQTQKSWQVEEDGALLGQLVRPLQTVGIYVPGGKAAYPSSVLMNAIPAQVAGVEKIVMVSPAPGGQTNAAVLVAADIVGVSEIYKIGGAQAVGAMAFGTATIPRVDKIVGPGNIYVALAKKLVFGLVDIDMIAGPSEILVVADESARADFVAADLLSQAEHDEEALPILLSTSEKLAREVSAELDKQKQKLKRREIIEVSLKNKCQLFVVRNLEEAVDLANRMAPEHLELAVEAPESWLEKIHNAGAVFLGHYTPEAVGDYFAGPNHVLPTSGTARFSSPLGVYDFIKKTSVIRYSKECLEKNSRSVENLAKMENLDAHARAVEIRKT
jgi:histidinol dehydrogenase